MNSISNSNHDNKVIDFSLIFQELWGNKWLVLSVAMVSCLLAFLYASRQVPQYTSSVILQLDSNRQAGSAGISGMLSQQLNLGSSANNFEAREIALIKSRVILSNVVKSSGLDIEVTPVHKQSWIMRHIHPVKLKAKIKTFSVPTAFIDKAFYLIFDKKDHFRLLSLNKEMLLEGEIGVLATNSEQSISLLVEEMDAPIGTSFFLKKRSDDALVGSLQSRLRIMDLGDRQSTGVLQISMNDVDPKKAVIILNEIAKTIRAKDIRQNAAEASKTLEFLYKQLPITKFDLQKAEQALNNYRAKTGKIDLKLQSQYLLNQLTNIERQLSEIQIERIDKLQKYTANHPVIMAMDVKINELHKERKKLMGQLKKLPASDQITVNLMRDVEIKNALYLVLMNKIQELQVMKAGIVSNIRILSSAKAATSPLPVKKGVIYIVGILLGLILSFTIILARKFLSPRVDDPHWGEKHFEVPNLAVIPYSKEQFANTLQKDKMLMQFPLLAHVSPRNSSIESLRGLRTNLQIKLSCGTNNIVSILGISPGIGKTFISANLAYLLAMTGKRVLVMDTDMRRGTLHKYFNLSPNAGLSEYLSNTKTLDEILVHSIHQNLMVIPRGIYPDDPSELLMGDKFKKLLDHLSKQFDIVLIDTPPVLLVADAVVISAQSGVNYLVVGANAHKPSEITISIKRLINAGVTLNGSIFNFHKQAKTAATYQQKYGQYYDDKQKAQ